jgi:hypothetical protein
MLDAMRKKLFTLASMRYKGGRVVWWCPMTRQKPFQFYLSFHLLLRWGHVCCKRAVMFGCPRFVRPAFYILFCYTDEKCVVFMWYLMISIFGARSEYCMVNLLENYFYVTELFVGIFPFTDIRQGEYIYYSIPTIVFSLTNMACVQWFFYVTL